MTSTQLMKLAPKFIIEDIKMAFEDRKHVLDCNWVNSVDPETMDFVKSVYNKASNDCSLFSVFCLALK